VLFTGHFITDNYDDANIEVLSLKTGKWSIVQRGGYFGRYIPSGHLLYVRHSTLYAAPFNLDRLQMRGAPVPLFGDVAGNNGNGGGNFDASNGVLVYINTAGQQVNWPVVWVDRDGLQRTIPIDPGSYSAPRVSPDGRRLALTVNRPEGRDIVVYDLRLQTMNRLTFEGDNNRPVWSPDGKHIAFTTAGSQSISIRWVRADGAGGIRTLFEDKNEMDSWSFAPDGRLAFAWIGADSSYHLWTLPLDLRDPDNPTPGKPEPYLITPSTDMSPSFSPDGRWIAYSSGESGPVETFVRPFPPHGAANSAKWQISTDGGHYPIWSRTGSQLFFQTRANQIMVVDYAVNGDSFVAAKPRPWASKPLPPIMNVCCDSWNMDLAPDGKQWVMLPVPQGGTPAPRVTVLLNFFDELRRRVPVR
jgi:Tol biopolymer transport system component